MIKVLSGSEIYIEIIKKLYLEHGVIIDDDDAMFDVLTNSKPVNIYEATVFARAGKRKNINVSIPIRCIYDWLMATVYKRQAMYSVMSYLLMARAAEIKKKKTISIFTVLHNRFKEEVDMDILEFVQDPLGAGRKYASLFIGVSMSKFYLI